MCAFRNQELLLAKDSAGRLDHPIDCAQFETERRRLIPSQHGALFRQERARRHLCCAMGIRIWWHASLLRDYRRHYPSRSRGRVPVTAKAGVLVDIF